MIIIAAGCLIVITGMGTVFLGYLLVSQVRQDKEFQREAKEHQRRMQELDEEIRRRRED